MRADPGQVGPKENDDSDRSGGNQRSPGRTDADGHPFVAQFQRYAEELLRPAALKTDRTDVPAATIERLAELGALNHLALPSTAVPDSTATPTGGCTRSSPGRASTPGWCGRSTPRSLTRSLTRALVVARSGHGIAGDDTAQLHARSALFILAQSQSTAVREAQLAHFHELITEQNRKTHS